MRKHCNNQKYKLMKDQDLQQDDQSKAPEKTKDYYFKIKGSEDVVLCTIQAATRNGEVINVLIFAKMEIGLNVLLIRTDNPAKALETICGLSGVSVNTLEILEFKNGQGIILPKSLTN